MNEVPTPQEAFEIDWNIVKIDIFWWPIEKWANAPYFNNFFTLFQDWRTMQNFKKFLDKSHKNFVEGKIRSFVLAQVWPRENWENWSITDESIQRNIIRYLAFAEYYRAFPIEVEALINLSSKFEKLSSEIIRYVSWEAHDLTEDYRNRLYNSYAYMRTQPWTFDAMLTA